MITAAVIGAGKMGAIVYKQLPETVNKLILDKDKEKARHIVFETGGKCCDSTDSFLDVDVFFLVLPASQIEKTIEQLAVSAKKGALFLNMATSVIITDKYINKYPHITVLDAKIIGHASSMEEGAPAYVIVKTEDKKQIKLIQELLCSFDKVIPGDADCVLELSTIGVKEAIKAVISLKKELQKFDIADDWKDVVIYSVCAGTMRSYVQNDLGPFAKELANTLEKEL